MTPLVIVQPGEKLPSMSGIDGDFAQWFARGMGLHGDRYAVVRPQDGEALPTSPGAVIVTGSSAMVTDDDDWIATTAGWLRAQVAAGVPVLGVCFGHQLLAHALGGTVADNPNGIEVGTVATRRTGSAADPLFDGLPTEFPVQVSHRQSVITLPPNAEPLAASAMDPHHAFRFGENAWGIQFHPEFNAAISPFYINHYADELTRNGIDVSSLRMEVAESPEGTAVLRHFAALLP